MNETNISEYRPHLSKKVESGGQVRVGTDYRGRTVDIFFENSLVVEAAIVPDRGVLYIGRQYGTKYVDIYLYKDTN